MLRNATQRERWSWLLRSRGWTHEKIFSSIWVMGFLGIVVIFGCAWAG